MDSIGLVDLLSILSLPNLRERWLESELMDSDSLERMTHFHALRDLGELNLLSLTARTIWKEIQGLTPDEIRELTILDVACGGGDITLSLHRLASRSGLYARADGCDLSQGAVDFARFKAERLGWSNQFFAIDALLDPLPSDYDFIVSSLFIHHLENQEIVRLLRQLSDQARIGFVLSDLLRSRWGYLLARLTTRSFSGSPIVHSDSLTSVRASLTVPEVEKLAQQAGLVGFNVRKIWPCRWLLSWSRNASQ